MQTTSVNPREEHREFWANNLTLPIDDPFWDKHRPGDQWNCKCWLEQTDAPRTALEDMPDSADIPEPKAGLKGNTAKTKKLFSQDHPHYPNKCAKCHLNTDGKVHGFKGEQSIKNGPQIGNCDKCRESDNCLDRISKMEIKPNSVTNPKDEAVNNLPSFDNNGMIARIRECEIPNFGGFKVTTSSYKEVFRLNRRFCQEKVDLAFYALNHISQWEYVGIPEEEIPEIGHKQKKYVIEKFYRGQAIYNGHKVEYLLLTNDHSKEYILHNVVFFK